MANRKTESNAMMTMKSIAKTKHNRVDLTTEIYGEKITISVDSSQEAEELIDQFKDVMDDIFRVWPELEEATE